MQRGQRARIARRDQESAATAVQKVHRGRQARNTRKAQDAAAISVQRVHRGRDAREGQSRQRRAATTVQKVHRGRHARQDGSILDLLSGQATRRARKEAEALLRQEALELDKLVLAQRRVLARKHPSEYLQMLYDDDQAMGAWCAHASQRHACIEATLRLQVYCRVRPMTFEARRALEAATRNARTQLRDQIVEIQDYRDETRAQATRFFELVSIPLQRRVRELNRRKEGISERPNHNANLGEAHRTRQVNVHATRTNQDELLRAEKTIKRLAELIQLFVNRKELRQLKKDEDPYESPGVVMKKLVQINRDTAKIRSPRSLKRMGDRWKVAERKELQANALASHYSAGVLEDRLALREEQRAVVELSEAVRHTRRRLDRLRSSKVIKQLPHTPPAACSTSEPRMRPEGEAAIPPGDPSAQVAATHHKQSHPLQEGHITYASIPSPPRTAPAGVRGRAQLPQARKEVRANAARRGRVQQRDTAALSAGVPALEWHVHHPTARPQTSVQPHLKGSRSQALQTAGLDLPSLSVHDGPQTDPLKAESPSVSPTSPSLQKATILVASPIPRRHLGPRLLNAYGKPLPWSPVRYDAGGERWVSSPSPTTRNPPMSLPRRGRRVKQSRSLPALLVSTYGANLSTFDPREWSRRC